MRFLYRVSQDDVTNRIIWIGGRDSSFLQLSWCSEPRVRLLMLENRLLGVGQRLMSENPSLAVGILLSTVEQNFVIGSGCWAGGNSSLAGAGLSLRAQRSHGNCVMTTFMNRKQGEFYKKMMMLPIPRFIISNLIIFYNSYSYLLFRLP